MRCCLLVLDQGRQPSSAAAGKRCPGQGAVSFALSKKTELRLCHILLRTRRTSASLLARAQ